MKILCQIETNDVSRRISVSSGTLIAEAVRMAGLFLNTSCAGKGTCGGCAVDLLDGVYERNNERIVVGEGKKRRVLGCQTRILEGKVRIFVPRRSLIETGEKVVAEFVIKEHRQFSPTVMQVSVELAKQNLGDAKSDYEQLVDKIGEEYDIRVSGIAESALRDLGFLLQKEERRIEVVLAWVERKWKVISVSLDGKEASDCYGLAVDIGTTTVAASLVDITRGEIVDTVTCYNQQIREADDVAARIVSASCSEGLNKLQRLIIDETLNPLIELLCGKHNIGCDHIRRIVISGNTVMWHIFYGLSPYSIGVVPFQPVARKVASTTAHNLGLNIFPEAPIDIVPSISGYVGGDIVSDLEICRAHYHKGVSLLVDIGTNGEIAISDGDKMYVTACAAGPAFEGLRISHGMRASVGAIERIRLGSGGCDCEYKVIGSGRAVGICGSALIDFLAEALREGVINSAGRIDRDKAGNCTRIRCGENNIYEYVIAYKQETEDKQSDITISEKDIEIVLQAKAAIFSAICILLKRLGYKTKFDVIERIFLAGGFAKYIDIRNAIAIGLLPDVDIGRYEIIGNGSLAGAFLGLIDRGIWDDYDRLIDLPEIVELNLDEDFQDEYTFALFLPNMRALGEI